MNTLARAGLFLITSAIVLAVVSASQDKTIQELKFNEVMEVAPGVFFRYSSISATGNWVRITSARRAPLGPPSAASRRVSRSLKPIWARRACSSAKRAATHWAAWRRMSGCMISPRAAIRA